MKTVRMKTRNIFEGGPPHVLCYGTQQLMFYCIFAMQIRGCVALWNPIFLAKSAKNSIHFRKFFQKINFLRFTMVSNEKILRFWTKSPIKLHTGHF